MNYSFNVRILSHFYHSAVKAELERRNFPKDMAKKIFAEHKAIVTRAKDIGKSKLMSSYMMGAYFIAMNRSTGKTAELRNIKRRIMCFKAVSQSCRECRQLS